MRVFVTGATGFIGSAVLRGLLDAGHEVHGLTRGAAPDGANAVRGTLEDLDVLRDASAASDGVIHTAFVHDFSQFAKSCAIDQAAITAIGEALAGTSKPFVITTGTPVIDGRVSTEHDDAVRTNPVSALRAPAEDLAVAFAKRGVRTSIARLPRAVHGTSHLGWKAGLVPALIDIARKTGVAGYVGDGAQRWPAVHRLDAARLYRLALEQAPAGARVHAVGEEGVSMRELAGAIGGKLGLPVEPRPPEHFGFFGGLVAIDQPSSSAITRAQLGWAPQGVGLLADYAANG